MSSGNSGHGKYTGASGDQSGRRISEFMPADAAAVAVLFNNSEEGWPGGFMRGVAMTAELVLHHQNETQPLSTLLSWEGDEVAGYCSFFENPGEQGLVGYIGLLNAATRFQGRGHGRDLLRAAVQRAIAQGHRRLDLHTWSGNMKAVPLYKKTGFFWVPETEVHMENYLPQLLTLPALSDFWAEADWYTAYRRSLDVHEDLIVDGKMRVYLYEFLHGDRYVRATIDATAHGLTRLETERWSVRCTVDDRVLIVGRPGMVRWEVENRTGRPLPLTLLASTGRGLQLRKEESVVVHGRYTTEAMLEAAHDYQPPSFDQPTPRIESLLVLDGMPLRLETGVEIKPPFDLRLDPLRVSLLPGETRDIPVRLRNAMEEAATAHLTFTPSPGLHLELPDAPVGPGEANPSLALTLGPLEYAGTLLRVRAAAAGAHVIEVRGDVQGDASVLPIPPITLPLPAVGPGDFISLQTTTPAPEHAERASSAREVRVESATHRLIVNLQAGQFRLEDTLTETGLATGYLMAGPPFSWASQSRVTHEATMMDKRDGGLAVTLRGAVPHLPDCIVEHELTLLAGGLLRLVTSVANAGVAARAPEVVSALDTVANGPARIVLPTIHGLIASTALEFPDWGDLELRQPSVYTEGWLAREGNDHVVGVIWSDVSTVRTGRWSLVEVSQQAGTLQPGGSTVLGPIYLYAGPGTWQTVRAHWRALLRPTASPDTHTPRDVVSLAGAAVPRALLAGPASASLSSVAARETTGRLTFDVPAGWTVTPQAHDVSALRVGVGRDVRVVVARDTGAPRAAPLRARLRSERDDVLALDGALLDLGGTGSVVLHDEDHEGQSLLVVDNGLLRFRVAPGFLGSVVSLRSSADESEHLLSSFPSAREFGWMRPWFGGLHPVIYPPGESHLPSPGQLPKEKFEAMETAENGHDGRVWRGVAVRSLLCSRGLRGLELHAAYLTLPASTVLLTRLSVRNHTRAHLSVHAGMVAYLQPGGTIEGAELLTGPATGRRYLRAQRTDEVTTDGWLAVCPAVRGPLIAVMSGHKMALSGIDWGTLGAHAGATSLLRLAPDEEQSRLLILALAADEREARAYGSLSGIGTPP